MAGVLYLRPLETPAGNRGHEVVMLVSREAVLAARQNAEDARRRANAGQREAEAARRAAALHGAMEAWKRDRAKGVTR